MSKIKWYRYFLASALLLVACACFALADGSTTVATVNGVPYSSLEDAAAAAGPSDYLAVVSDCSVSGSLTINSRFYIPRGVTVTTNNFISLRGQSNLYGNIRGTATDPSYVLSASSGVTNIYGNIYSAVGTRCLIILGTAEDGTVVNIFGGEFTATSNAVRNYKDASNLNIYGGTFTPGVTGDYNLNGATVVSSSPFVVSYGGLYEIGRVVSESLQWISLFCAMIVANKLLLIFLLVVFSALGIGLIKRVVR